MVCILFNFENVFFFEHIPNRDKDENINVHKKLSSKNKSSNYYIYYTNTTRSSNLNEIQLKDGLNMVFYNNLIWMYDQF